MTENGICGDEFVDDIERAFGSKRKVSKDLVAKLHRLASDDEFADAYKSNIITYASILKNGRYKVEQYINAVKFVTHRVSGMSSFDAYNLVFPEKIKMWEEEGRDGKRMSVNISIFSNGDLVVAIMEQAKIPTHILNHGLFQEALNVAADIMRNSGSDLARVKALDSILTNTKSPEVSKIELDVGIKQNSIIGDLRSVVQDMAILQAKDIEAGKAVKLIAESTIINAEVLEDD